MSKLKETIKKALEKTYWVNSVGSFKNFSDYPQEFEQKFGNISLNTIVLDDYLIDARRLDDIQDFFRKWNFDVTQQYKINDFKAGYYFNDSLYLMVRCNFGLPENKVDKENDDEEDGFVGLESGVISISFCPLIENRDNIHKFIDELVEMNVLFIPDSEKNFYMIAQNAQGLYKQKTTFNNIEIKDGEYSLYYGDDFPYEKIIKFSDEKSNNLMVFYGPPGCGKTNFIKNMITKFENDVIYVPPSMVNIIAEPSFVSFMLQNQGCTLIVEDAEQILCNERSSATTNLLNLTDGFLKDALKIKVIATMNADIKSIDTALLRKGRLHLSHNFGKLSAKFANRLAKHCGINHTFEEETALCDIFNVEEFDSPLKKQERAIGFGNF
jgi:hypothetical protein